MKEFCVDLLTRESSQSIWAGPCSFVIIAPHSNVLAVCCIQFKTAKNYKLLNNTREILRLECILEFAHNTTNLILILPRCLKYLDAMWEVNNVL